MFSGSVASVTPSGDAVTMREHDSFVELPDNNYKPRYDDPRAGYGGLTTSTTRRRSASRWPALHPSASPPEGRPVRAHERSRQADHALRRSRDAGADSNGGGVHGFGQPRVELVEEEGARHPIRSPATPCSRGRPTAGASTESGSPRSKPARTEKRSATSSTERASGPTVSNVQVTERLRGSRSGRWSDGGR